MREEAVDFVNQDASTQTHPAPVVRCVLITLVSSDCTFMPWRYFCAKSLAARDLSSILCDQRLSAILKHERAAANPPKRDLRPTSTRKKNAFSLRSVDANCSCGHDSLLPPGDRDQLGAHCTPWIQAVLVGENCCTRRVLEILRVDLPPATPHCAARPVDISCASPVSSKHPLG